jgi:hypothetical protein
MSTLENPDNFTTTTKHQRSGGVPATRPTVDDREARNVVPLTRARARQVLRAAPAWAPFVASTCLVQCC